MAPPDMFDADSVLAALSSLSPQDAARIAERAAMLAGQHGVRTLTTPLPQNQGKFSTFH
jgi:hypothetical protein